MKMPFDFKKFFSGMGKLNQNEKPEAGVTESGGENELIKIEKGKVQLEKEELKLLAKAIEESNVLVKHSQEYWSKNQYANASKAAQGIRNTLYQIKKHSESMAKLALEFEKRLIHLRNIQAHLPKNEVIFPQFSNQRYAYEEYKDTIDACRNFGKELEYMLSILDDYLLAVKKDDKSDEKKQIAFQRHISELNALVRILEEIKSNYTSLLLETKRDDEELKGSSTRKY